MNKKLFAVFIAMGIVFSACNLPGITGVEPDILTAAALTVDAALLATPSTALASATAPAPTVSVPAGTFTPGPPVLSVSVVTDCRMGPGDTYEQVMRLTPGQQVPLVGNYPPNYWLVNTQQGPCWVHREFATPAGSYLSVPRVTPPATPIGATPLAPSFPQVGWTYFCFNTGKADITLNWNDKATNEVGYRILRNGEAVAELPANSTFFAETINLDSGESITYEIQAYNGIGTANSKPATMTCP